MAKNTSDVIDATAAAENCERWEFPDVLTTQQRAGTKSPRLAATAGRVEELQRQAQREASEVGRREGIEKGKQQVQAQVARLESIMRSLARPLEQFDGRTMEEIAALAIAIARHIVRREIRAEPGEIMAVIQQAAAVLPASSRRMRLYLNSEDAAFVRDHMTALPDAAWQVIEDPALARGGCRVESEHSRIDASIERRLAAIAADILGGEREGDAGVASG